MKRLGASAILIAALAAGLANAQGAPDRSAALVSLSSIFGELHHIRRTCEPDREGDVWRNRMKKLIDLEAPDSGLRERMVSAFNEGYQRVQDRFPACSRDAESYAASRASEGKEIVAQLTAPLYAAQRGEDSPDVTVYRGADPN